MVGISANYFANRTSHQKTKTPLRKLFAGVFEDAYTSSMPTTSLQPPVTNSGALPAVRVTDSPVPATIPSGLRVSANVYPDVYRLQNLQFLQGFPGGFRVPHRPFCRLFVGIHLRTLEKHWFFEGLFCWWVLVGAGGLRLWGYLWVRLWVSVPVTG